MKLKQLKRRQRQINKRMFMVASKFAKKLGRRAEVELVYNEILDIENELK